jgi:hypothetical protein
MKEELERAPNGPEQLQSLMLSFSSTLGIYCNDQSWTNDDEKEIVYLMETSTAPV